jgi:hypothetical protein
MQSHTSETHMELLRVLKARLLQQQAEYSSIESERDKCKAEMEKLLEEHETLKAAYERDRAALDHLFPYSAYRSRRPDLASLDDLQLIDHFVAYGIHEDVDLSYSSLLEHEKLQSEGLADESRARADFLEMHSLRTAAQLDLLNTIISKLLVNT